MFIRMPDSPATSLILKEEGGITLTLNDRFLPYRPITIGGRQRAEFTWYPGSPEATVQMLGPEEDTIQLSGFWKDKFFEVTQSAFTRMTSGSSDIFNLKLIESVSDLVQVVDDMRRMGRRITLEWSGLQRVGHIVGFRQTWHNVHDCEWQIDFAVVSQGETTVPAVSAVAITVPDVYLAAVKKLADLQDAIIASSGLPAFIEKTNAFNAATNIANLYITGVANATLGIVQGYAGAVLSVSQSSRRTVSTLAGGVKNLAVSIGTIGDSALSELYSWGVFGAEDNTAAGQVIAAFNYKRIISDQVQTSRYLYASQAAEIAQQTNGTDSQVQTYTATEDTDYRDVSTQFYGTPLNWYALMSYNGATDSRLTAGTLVYVPPAHLLTAGGSTRGGV